MTELPGPNSKSSWTALQSKSESEEDEDREDEDEKVEDDECWEPPCLVSEAVTPHS